MMVRTYVLMSVCTNVSYDCMYARICIFISTYVCSMYYAVVRTYVYIHVFIVLFYDVFLLMSCSIQYYHISSKIFT